MDYFDFREIDIMGDAQDEDEKKDGDNSMNDKCGGCKYKAMHLWEFPNEYCNRHKKHCIAVINCGDWQGIPNEHNENDELARSWNSTNHQRTYGR